MFKKVKTDVISWIFLIGISLIVIEIALSGGGIIYSLAFALGMIFVGKRYFHRVFGKILFILGILNIIGTVLSMHVFQFFIIVVIGYFLLTYYQSKNHPKWVQPFFVDEPNTEVKTEPLIKGDFLFHNKFIGHQKTPNEPYEWHNMNIQTGVGNTVIDLSQTIIPKDHAVISVRSIVGNIQILVPYGVEVKIHHTVMAGRTEVFGHRFDEKLFNQVYMYETEEFAEATQKVHIVTAVIVGDIEVRRV